MERGAEGVPAPNRAATKTCPGAALVQPSTLPPGQAWCLLSGEAGGVVRLGDGGGHRRQNGGPNHTGTRPSPPPPPPLLLLVVCLRKGKRVPPPPSPLAPAPWRGWMGASTPRSAAMNVSTHLWWQRTRARVPFQPLRAVFVAGEPPPPPRQNGGGALAHALSSFALTPPQPDTLAPS